MPTIWRQEPSGRLLGSDLVKKRAGDQAYVIASGFWEAPGGAIGVNPGVGTLALTGHAPSVMQAIGVNPGVGTLALTGHAPSVMQAIGVNPGAGALALTGHAPSVMQAIGVNPGVGTLALTGHAPSVMQMGAVTWGCVKSNATKVANLTPLNISTVSFTLDEINVIEYSNILALTAVLSCNIEATAILTSKVEHCV